MENGGEQKKGMVKEEQHRLFPLGGEVGVRCSPRPKPPSRGSAQRCPRPQHFHSLRGRLLHRIPFLHRADALLLPAPLPFLSHRSATERLHSRLHSWGLGLRPPRGSHFGPGCAPRCRRAKPSPSRLGPIRAAPAEAHLLPQHSQPCSSHSTVPQCRSTAPPPAIHVLLGNLPLSAPPTTNTWPRPAFPNPSAPSASPAQHYLALMGLRCGSSPGPPNAAASPRCCIL